MFEGEEIKKKTQCSNIVITFQIMSASSLRVCVSMLALSVSGFMYLVHHQEFNWGTTSWLLLSLHSSQTGMKNVPHMLFSVCVCCVLCLCLCNSLARAVGQAINREFIVGLQRRACVRRGNPEWGELLVFQVQSFQFFKWGSFRGTVLVEVVLKWNSSRATQSIYIVFNCCRLYPNSKTHLLLDSTQKVIIK